MATPTGPHSELEPSDRDLLSRFVTKRDEAAFHLLVARHGGMVWSIVRRMLVCHQDREDVFQATFLKLLIHSQRQHWHASLGGWLHKVAYRLSLDVGAARERERIVELVEEPCVEEECWQAIQQQDAERALHEAIAQLPRRTRQAIVLHYFQSKSQEAAAEEMGCSFEAFRSLLARGRRKLYLRLGCRGMSCSLALAALGQTLVAATPVLPEFIEKAVFVGLKSPLSGGTGTGSPRVEQLCRGETMAMLQGGLANKTLTLICCTVLFYAGILGLFAEVYSGEVAQGAPLLVKQKADDKETDPETTITVQDRIRKAEIAKLIEQLGDASYEQREAAAKRLENLGEAELEQLKSALDHTNVEVRERVRRLLALPEFREIQQRRRLLEEFYEAFVEGTMKEEIVLPGWRRYREIVGDDPVARQLFVEMQKAEPELLSLYEKQPDKVAEALERRWNYHHKIAEERDDEVEGDLEQLYLIPLGAFASFILILGDESLHFPESLTERQLSHNYTPINYAGCTQGWLQFRGERIPSDENAPLIRLLDRWVGRPQATRLPEDTFNKLFWAPKYDCREGGLYLATEMVRRRAEKGMHKEFFEQEWLTLFHVLGRWGDASQIPLLEPLLESQEFIDRKGKQVYIPLADFALALMVRLSGQAWEDYGIQTHFDDNSGFEGYSPIPPLFKNDQSRQAALAKWHAWIKENPVKATEESAK